jgi:hypothetical protein
VCCEDKKLSACSRERAQRRRCGHVVPYKVCAPCGATNAYIRQVQCLKIIDFKDKERSIHALFQAFLAGKAHEYCANAG